MKLPVNNTNTWTKNIHKNFGHSRYQMYTKEGRQWRLMIFNGYDLLENALLIHTIINTDY